eukprot:Amastigsp_a842815_39.p4 type:complete len:165 gc:universal Amastigsp_a842815_39:1469-975(-)
MSPRVWASFAESRSSSAACCTRWARALRLSPRSSLWASTTRPCTLCASWCSSGSWTTSSICVGATSSCSLPLRRSRCSSPTAARPLSSCRCRCELRSARPSTWGWCTRATWGAWLCSAPTPSISMQGSMDSRRGSRSSSHARCSRTTPSSLRTLSRTSMSFRFL